MPLKLILLFLAACAAPVLAQAAGWEPADRIREIASNFARTQSGPDVQVHAGALDQRLRLPACAQAPQAFVAPGSSGRGAMSVGVRCESPVAWTLYVPVRISQSLPVLVLTRSLARGETITADAIAPQTRDASTLPFGYITDPDQVIGAVLQRPLAIGTVLSPEMVRSARIVHRGQQVTLVGRVGGLEVRATGTALADAGRGERVQVRNSHSQRTVEGVVSGAGTVEVQL
ncbi:MAG TPA: flagellar basal body P-ring formation chaperone FlgA [Stenotrophobium sp.]|jgi:flagella basal body P-ring formation protein FlgA|nr:flagellar basal body P-ring formation chaperone FlgA [Stenotrophobium sp.]